jgi:thiosulfate/3-mercaptopyruvate sulfurtransferase
LLDASSTQRFAKKHIPGSVSVDLYSYGVREPELSKMEERIQSWGVRAGKKIVIYDEGASMMAARLFFDLVHYGFPASDMMILDGGLFKWEAGGGAVTKDPTPAPAKGTFRIAKVNEDVRVRLPEFLVASGDTKNNALVEALDTSYHYGETKFFGSAGHIPHAINLPVADFYNADKTFKSPEELRRMMAYLGIKPEQQIHSHCGGGVAAAVPFFAMKFLLDYPKVKLYKESQLEWLRDERNLPFWTYAAPNMMRESVWVSGWGSPMMRMYGVANMSVVDVRPADAYNLGHVPFAVNISADVFKRHIQQPEKLPALLGPAGVDAAHEAVIVSEGGLNESSALAYVMLQRLGQKKVSILLDSVDDWGMSGQQLTKEPTIVGARKTPKDMVVPAVVYAGDLRDDIAIKDATRTKGYYPKVFLASGGKMPAKAQEGKVVHVPYASLLNAGGKPKPAKEIHGILTKAGVPRYAEIICVADEPGEAAVNYVILKLMGYPDVKVLL